MLRNTIRKNSIGSLGFIFTMRRYYDPGIARFTSKVKVWFQGLCFLTESIAIGKTLNRPNFKA
ncbi:hypothetical protein M9Y82_08220 [Leptospira weilii]|nr:MULTISPECIES: hypothetical protein [Leptospira]MCL8266633.1 hypothetical protein [Leptospira weilii]